jgi:uracil-DNA glycosylase
MSIDLRQALIAWLEERAVFGPLGDLPAGISAAQAADPSAWPGLRRRLGRAGGEGSPGTASPRARAVPSAAPPPPGDPPAEERAPRPLPPMTPAAVAGASRPGPSAHAANRPQQRSGAPAPPAFEPPGDWEGLRAAVSACTRCPLAERRTRTVFGVGDQQADLLIIGEAPGEQEDLRGEPFVGPAGELLDKMLAAIGFARDDVYIANILKCRPPGNRDPLPGEVACCRPYLEAQIGLLRPRLVLALGRIAGRTLLGGDATLSSMRGKVHDLGGRPLRVSYHPAALLRNSHWKRPAWEDLQALRRHYDELGGRPGRLEGQVPPGRARDRKDGS